MNNQGYSQYKQTAVQTATPEKLVLMLFDGAIKFSQQAVVSLEEKNIELSNLYIGKVQAIITEFMASLDMQYEISRYLMAIYEYMNRVLVKANIDKNPELVREVIGYLKELRQSFDEANSRSREKNWSNNERANIIAG